MVSGRDTHFSTFGGLWSDRRDAKDFAADLAAQHRITDQELRELLFWIDDGYVIKEGAIEGGLLDRVQADIYSAARTGSRHLTFWDAAGKHQQRATLADLSKREAKLLDVHALKSVQEAIFGGAIGRFLDVVFQTRATAFQSLYLENGSEQGLHQDTAFVYVDKPLEFVASWIALEDVQAGSGELVYYPGSHRLPDKIFASGSKALPGTDPQWATNSDDLQSRCDEARLSERRFLPKRGDVLFWAADLAHGGATRSGTATRRSLVTHYCPIDRRPPYALDKKAARLVLHNGHAIMSAT